MQVNNKSFGKLISKFRCLLGLTEEEFGNILSINKTNIIKIETTINIEDLDLELLFGLFYYTFKLIQDSSVDNAIKKIAIEVYNIINFVISEKIDETLEISRRYQNRKIKCFKIK